MCSCVTAHVSVRVFVRYGLRVRARVRASVRVLACREKKGQARGGGRNARGQVADDVRMVGLL